MGSLIVKLDGNTQSKLRNRHRYSDIDMLGFNVDCQEVPIKYDVEAVRISIRNILMWRVGESILRPGFGHRLHQSMYSQLNGVNKEKVCSEIKRAIEENEPRAQIKAVDAMRDDKDEDDNSVHIKVTYSVVGNSSSDAEFVEESVVKGK